MTPIGIKAQKRLLLEAIVLLALIIGLFFSNKPSIARIENIFWDARLNLLAKISEPDPRIAIITIDQASLNYFASKESIYWPWPRSIYGEITKFLKDSGARGIAYDILFTEPSVYGVEDDLSFGETATGSPPVVVAASLRETASKPIDTEERLKISLQPYTKYSNIFSSLKKQQHFAGITLPTETFGPLPLFVGNVSATPDSDGLFRSTAVAAKYNDRIVPSLPFAIAALTGDLSNFSQNIPWNSHQEEEFEIRFYGPPRTIPTFGFASIAISATQLANGEVPVINQNNFTDKYVFIGMDAPGLLDLRPTPLGSLYPGTEFQATVLSNILQNSFIERVSDPFQLIFTVLSALLMGIILLSNDSWLKQLLLAIGAIIAVLAFATILSLLGFWLSIALPILLMILTTLIVLAFQYTKEGKQHRFIRDAFKLYVSPELIDRMVEDPTTLKIGGDRRELTMFFSDIEGFTSISERLDPQILSKLLNRFLSEMSNIILQHGGTVDKYVGDAIVAFWNAPLPVKNHADLAVQAAIKCQSKLKQIADELKKEFNTEIKMRIGIHTGSVSVGNFGSKDRFNYTILGDSANLASRLEGANKYFGTYILLSGDTVKQLSSNIKIRKLANIQVVGRTSGIDVYQPLEERENSEEIKNLEKFNEAINLYESGEIKTAQELFKTIKSDVVSERYIERINKLILISNSEKWNPTWSLTEK